MYLLDTNVISELVRRAPDAAVTQWIAAQRPQALAISAITIGEIARGVALLPAGARRDLLHSWARHALAQQFAGRVHPVDEGVAARWGEMSAAAQRQGRPLGTSDGLILATAAAHDLVLVTRDFADLADRGVALLDPWTGAQAGS